MVAPARRRENGRADFLGQVFIKFLVVEGHPLIPWTACQAESPNVTLVGQHRRRVHLDKLGSGVLSLIDCCVRNLFCHKLILPRVLLCSLYRHARGFSQWLGSHGDDLILGGRTHGLEVEVVFVTHLSHMRFVHPLELLEESYHFCEIIAIA